MNEIRKRRLEEEGKETQFRLRKLPVASEKLERFTKRKKTTSVGDEDIMPFIVSSRVVDKQVLLMIPSDANRSK